MYCDTIPYELAVKLKEKGYPQDHDVRYVWLNGRAVDVLWLDEFGRCQYDDADRDGTLVAIPTYAQVFDWLMEKDFIITISAVYYGVLAGWQPHYNHWGLKRCDTWDVAANAAIENALELIKEESK